MFIMIFPKQICNKSTFDSSKTVHLFMESNSRSQAMSADRFLVEATRRIINDNHNLVLKETSTRIKCVCLDCDFNMTYSKDKESLESTNLRHTCTPVDGHKNQLPKAFINRCVFKSYIKGCISRSNVKKIINEDLTCIYQFTKEEDTSISNSIKAIKKEFQTGVSDGWYYIESFLSNYAKENGENLVSTEYKDGKMVRMCIKAPYASAISSFPRNLLFMDGCFVSASYGGCLLIMITMSPERTIIPISLCYCDGETKENTSYFLKFNSEFLVSDATIITDHSKVFEECIKQYPVKHGLCLFHLVQKMKSHAKDHIELMAKANSFDVYEEHRSILEKKYPSIYKKLEKYLDKYFYHAGGPRRYSYTSSSPIESFNSLILNERKDSIVRVFDRFVELAEKAYIDVVHTIKTKFSPQQIDRLLQCPSSTCDAINDACSQWITKMVEKNIAREDLSFVQSLSNSRTKVFAAINHYKGFHGVEQFRVNVITGECSCGKLKDDGFPCVHMQKALGVQSLEYVDEFWRWNRLAGFLKVKFIRTGLDDLSKSSVDIKPDVLSKPGRPRSRFKTFGEIYWSKTTKKIITNDMISVSDNPRKKLIDEFDANRSRSNDVESSFYMMIKECYRLVSSLAKQHSLNKQKIIMDKITSVMDPRAVNDIKEIKRMNSHLLRYSSALRKQDESDDGIIKIHQRLTEEREQILRLIDLHEKIRDVYEREKMHIDVMVEIRKRLDVIALDLDT